MSDSVLVASGLSKTYRSGPDELTVWGNVELNIQRGETISIVGASGSGKTTLLNVLGGLDTFDQGEIELNGRALTSMSEQERTISRNQDVGFVYQFHHLLPEFSALENVMMPLRIRGGKLSEIKKTALACLESVGLKARAEHTPAELSGGERQRVAIARALVGQPKIILLDEPTGNLDQQTAAQVEDVLLELSKTAGTAFVIVTHDESLAGRADRRYRLENLTLTEVS